VAIGVAAAAHALEDDQRGDDADESDCKNGPEQSLSERGCTVQDDVGKQNGVDLQRRENFANEMGDRAVAGGSDLASSLLQSWPIQC
jgi:hypothetical protein